MIKLLFAFLILFCNIANASLPEPEIHFAEYVIINNNDQNDDDAIESVAAITHEEYQDMITTLGAQNI